MSRSILMRRAKPDPSVALRMGLRVVPGATTCRGVLIVRIAVGVGALLGGLPPDTWAGDLRADPVAGVALALAVILIAAKFGGEAAVRLGQAAVVGELLAGVLLGNLPLLGYPGLAFVGSDSGVNLLARLGVLLLLFEVGVESTVGQMFRVGPSALCVAVLGVATPFALGWGAAAVLLPAAHVYVHAFIGAVLSATSVGITARVLKDLKRGNTDEARIILGAAVIDDVLGLFIMAVVAAVIAAADRGEGLSYGALGGTLAEAGAFLLGGIALGVWVTPRIFHAGTAMRSGGALLTLGLGFCFLGAWAAGLVGLAPIIGAFAAGLVLEDLHSRPYVARGERSLAELLHPLTGFLAPVFFVVMGMRTDLRVFCDPGTLGLAAALIVAGVLGKLACSLGPFGAKINRLAIGIGMMPRGEVGLIFANVGAALTLGGQPIVTPAIFSAIVVMVIVTTLATPPALMWALKRK